MKAGKEGVLRCRTNERWRAANRPQTGQAEEAVSEAGKLPAPETESPGRGAGGRLESVSRNLDKARPLQARTTKAPAAAEQDPIGGLKTYKI